MTVRHLLTCEYPPQIGGVADHTRSVAAALAAAGEEVHVWCPPRSGETTAVPGVTIHSLPDRFAAAGRRQAGRELNRFPTPRRLLVQWVPHGYGQRSLNLFFCLWLRRRARRQGDIVDLVVHEPFLELGGSVLRSGAATVHRVMMVVLLAAATRVWVPTAAWIGRLRPWAPRRRRLPIAWLPVPPPLPPSGDPAAVVAIRRRLLPAAEVLVGHFGTYGKEVAEPLEAAATTLLDRRPELGLLLLGRGGETFRAELVARRPDIESRAHAPGVMAPLDLARHLAACDLMLQPYPDGVSGRRTTAVAALAEGRPMVTTDGPATEEIWRQGVRLVPAGDPEAMAEAACALLADPESRLRLGAAASRLAREVFAISTTISKLLASE